MPKPATAESTLVRGSIVSSAMADMLDKQYLEVLYSWATKAVW